MGSMMLHIVELSGVCTTTTHLQTTRAHLPKDHHRKHERMEIPESRKHEPSQIVLQKRTKSTKQQTS